MKDRYWEDRFGLIHRVPFSVGDSYTACNRRIAWDPGRWTERPTACIECLAVVGGSIPRAPIERVAGYWSFKWPFRTTGGMIHGVPSNTANRTQDLTTFCGISTHAKLLKGTGDWTHGTEPMTCIGCIAAAGGP